MKKITLLIFAAFFCFLSSADLQNSSDASESAPVRCAIPKFEKAFEQAAAVFVGTVLSQKTEGQTKIFELKVTKYWKGVEARKMTIHVYETPRIQAQFEVGESYLVFAEADDDGRLFDRRCSRTKPLAAESDENLKEDLESLGAAKTCISLENE